jgi:hypothetical protein
MSPRLASSKNENPGGLRVTDDTFERAPALPAEAFEQRSLRLDQGYISGNQINHAAAEFFDGETMRDAVEARIQSDA